MSEKTRRLKLSIFHKLLITMLLVALLPLGGVWYVSRGNAIRDLNSNIEIQLSTEANDLVEQVNNWGRPQPEIDAAKCPDRGDSIDEHGRSRTRCCAPSRRRTIG